MVKASNFLSLWIIYCFPSGASTVVTSGAPNTVLPSSTISSSFAPTIEVYIDIKVDPIPGSSDEESSKTLGPSDLESKQVFSL
jgi:hypothetical protein